MRLVDADVLKTLFDVRYDTAFIQERTRENKEQWNGYCTGINWGRNTIADAPTVNAVVAPCKIGSTIYMIVTKCHRIGLPEFSFIKTTYMTEANFFRVCRDYGKTVFLTREEAEAALAKMDRKDDT